MDGRIAATLLTVGILMTATAVHRTDGSYSNHDDGDEGADLQAKNGKHEEHHTVHCVQSAIMFSNGSI